MATLDVINLEKQKVGTIDLPDEIVNAPVDSATASAVRTPASSCLPPGACGPLSG